ncbi:hypothetical protein YPPY14_3610, partial [Yersinia pestis PY-14]
MVIIYQYSHL